MIAIMNPDLTFWTISYWGNGPGMNQWGFSIWMSPRFLEYAYDAIKTLNRKHFQLQVRELIYSAGYDRDLYTDEKEWVKFGEWGLMHMDVPGNACGLDWDMGNSQPLARGANLLPHNVDGPLQQSLLMGIWMLWANYVECIAYRQRQPVKQGVFDAGKGR